MVVFAVSLLIWGFAVSQEKPETPTPPAKAEKVTKPDKADTSKKKEHAYVGINRCKMCHNTKKWGKIYDKWAATKHASGTNFCLVHPAVDVRTNRVIIISCLDNLIKGAAGQAIQNMNIMLGFPETAGLEGLAIFP